LRVLLPALLLATLALPLPVATAAPGPVCTGDLIESVQACATTGGCVTVWLGPSATGACAGDLLDTSPVCTHDLIESIAVCIDAGARCVTVYTGPAARPVCLSKLAL